MALKQRYRIPLVADFRDPWVSCPWAPPESPSHGPNLRQRWEAHQERRLMREADAIIANTPNTAQALAEVYPLARERITSIPNGFDPEVFQPPLLLTPKPPDAPITLLHPGQLYAGRDPRPLLRALAGLHRDARSDVRFHLRFIGHLESDARDYDIAAEARSLDLGAALSVEPQLPYAHVIEEMRRSDILLLLDTPARRLGVPAKLYEFLGAGRPILSLTEPGSDSDIILASSRVVYVQAAPSDTSGIERALRELVLIVMRERDALAPAPISPAASPYTRENATRALATLLESVRRAPSSTEDQASRAIPKRGLYPSRRSVISDLAPPPDPGH
jgi:glycosyltransferase involved in cell wall biosynthesis